MISGEINPTTKAKAYELQERADRLTAFRMNHSDEIGLAIGSTKRGWLTFIAGCAMAYTDLQDGRYAKKAQKLLGEKDPLSNGATDDPIADKKFRKAMLQGIRSRALTENDEKTIAVIDIKSKLDEQRDKRMARSRKLASDYTDLSLGALPINRAKTATEMTGILIHTSPLANNERIRGLALGMLSISSGLGLIGERQYSNIVENEIEIIAERAPHKLEPLD